jgi:outer membrane protein
MRLRATRCFLDWCTMQIFRLLACVLLAAPAAAAASSLLELFDEALANDPEYAVARHTAEAARERKPQALAGLLPVVTATAGATSDNARFGAIRRNYGSHTSAVTLTQPLYNRQAYAEYEQAPWRVVQSDATLEQARIDLALRLTRAFLDVAEAHGNLEAAHANKAFLEEQVKQARKAFEHGTATITDTQETQARLDLATAQENEAINRIRVRRAALRSMTGNDPGNMPALVAAPALELPGEAGIEQWEKLATTGNLRVRASEAALKVAELEVDRANAVRRPTVDLVASYNNNVTGASQYLDTRSEARTLQVGIQLSIPLYRGGSIDSKAREAASLLDAARASLNEVRSKAVLSVDEAYLGMESGVAQVRALEAALTSAATASQSNRLGYRFGIRNNVDVLDSEQQVYQIKRDLLRARLDALFALFKLKAATGLLRQEDLMALNSRFE